MYLLKNPIRDFMKLVISVAGAMLYANQHIHYRGLCGKVTLHKGLSIGVLYLPVSWFIEFL